MQDLVGGRLDYQCEPLPTALPLIQGNAAKPIALLARKRSDVVPEIPTADEQGLKDFEVLSWNALFLPKGTPEPIVRRLNAAMSEALDTPWVRDRLEKLGLEVPEPAAAHAGISRDVSRKRDQEMGGADQGQRRLRRITLHVTFGATPRGLTIVAGPGKCPPNKLEECPC